MALIQRRVRVLTANGDDLTDSSDPSRKMMRQIAGAFHEYERARLVANSRSREIASGWQVRRSQVMGRDQSRTGARGEAAAPAFTEGRSTVAS